MALTTPKTLGVAIALAAFAAAAQARDQIRIVGSSTLFPFSAAVAEYFGKTTSYKTPIVESTGSGGGLKLFCAGIGTHHPDIANASREINDKEKNLCEQNGVTEMTEAKVGYDGIVIANAKPGPDFRVSIAELVVALAENGPKPRRWSEVDPSFPNILIEVLGPPPSSGTRDAFEELVMQEGCDQTSKVSCDGVSVREDGVYVDAGENDNLIVSKLTANPNAMGIFGFSFLDQNQDKLKGAVIDGVEPTFDNIAAGDYPVSRSLFFYVKKAHAPVIPGVKDYAEQFLSTIAVGEEGYLVDKGLIPMQPGEFEKYRKRVSELATMPLDDVQEVLPTYNNGTNQAVSVSFSTPEN